MDRVGVFLDAHPWYGGAYQYSLGILEALAGLPADRFEACAAHTAEHWVEPIERLGLRRIPLQMDAGTRACAKLVRFGLLPLPAWHRVAPRTNPTFRAMAQAGCSVWLYPCQDEWAYLGPGRSLVSVHDLMHRYERRFPEVSALFKYQRREMHYRKLCAAPHHVLVDSELGKRHVVDSYEVSDSRVHALPFIAPGYIYRDGAMPPGDIPGKFFFYPAQFWAHKNHDTLLRALAVAAREAPDMALVLVGSRKNHYDSMHRLICALGLTGRVAVLDYVPDTAMPQLYKRARALIMPSFFGPTNIPPLEAFACGCPVAVSRIYAMPEQLGDAALYFDPESVEELAGVMLRMWRDDALCAELARRGREADRRWNRAQFGERLRTILEQVIACT